MKGWYRIMVYKEPPIYAVWKGYWDTYVVKQGYLEAKKLMKSYQKKYPKRRFKIEKNI